VTAPTRPRAASGDSSPAEAAAIQRYIDARIRQAEARMWDQIAAAIEQHLAEDRADDDVTSGEAIWEQAGYRTGLSVAAQIARDGS
jgi:hypothetical protein